MSKNSEIGPKDSIERKTSFKKRKYFLFSRIPSRSQILTWIILFVILLDVLYITYALFNSVWTIDFYISVFLFFILLLTLFLNLKGYFLSSSVFFIILFSLSIFFMAITNFMGLNPYYSSTDVNLLIFLIFPVLLAGLFLPKTWTIGFTLLVSGGLLLLPLPFPSISLSDIILGPLLLFGSISFLTIVSSFYQAEVEKTKRLELLKNKQELESVNKKLSQTKSRLKEINDHLEELVSLRTKKIEDLVEQKNDFIHMLGHDLKNPLGPILNLLPIAATKVQNEEVKKLIHISYENAKQIKELIHETLKLSRFDEIGKEFNFQPIQLSDFVDRIIQQNDLLFEDNNIQITSSIDKQLLVEADETCLRELFTNLITNAVKYTPENKQGRIHIKAFSHDKTITISVTDNGKGLADHEKETIFEKFHKNGTPRTGMESSGLGLSICKRIVNQHHGKIWAESDGIGKGSTFYFTLPTTEAKNTTSLKILSKSQSHTHKEMYKKIDEI